MGAWGVGPFENDTAGDWLDELMEGSSVRPVAAAITRAQKKKNDSDIEFQGIAAAEVLAAARGRGTSADEELSEWLTERKYEPDEALVNQAREMIETIIDASEVAELFAEDPDWKPAMRRLAKALAAPAKTARKKVAERKPKASSKKKAPGTQELRRKLKAFYCVVYPTRGGDITSISCARMDDSVLQSVAAASCESLDSVCIDDASEISDAGLASLQTCRGLKKLRLKNAGNITDAGLRELQGLTGLETLELRRCTKITAAGLRAFIDCRDLRRLELAGTPIDDEFAAEIAKLEKLNQLWVRNTGLTDRGLKQIARKHTGLRKLYLAGNPLTDAGLESLTGLTELIWVDVAKTKITDKGVRTLARLSSLQALDLGATEVTDKSIAELTKLDLCFLNVDESGISAEGKEHLRDKLPRLGDNKALHSLSLQ
jgi:hypothetical protein